MTHLDGHPYISGRVRCDVEQWESNPDRTKIPDLVTCAKCRELYARDVKKHGMQVGLQLLAFQNERRKV